MYEGFVATQDFKTHSRGRLTYRDGTVVQGEFVQGEFVRGELRVP